MNFYLPEEILLQIFYKLPAKSLGRCMCVSKAWNFLIKNPSFIATHLNSSICRNNGNLFLVTNDSHDGYSLHFDDQQFSKYTQLQHLPSHDFIVGSSNGILCFVEFKHMNIKFSLCNPVIRKCVKIPKPYFSYLPYKVSIGFGFDSKRNDYKILIIVKEHASDVCNQVELYSLRKNSWGRLAPLKYDFHSDYFMVTVNEITHWIARERVNDHGRNGWKCLLLGFNMKDEVFKEIMLPESLSNLRDGSHMYVIPYEEFSSIAVIESAFLYEECNIWVMKKYGVVETWTKIFNIGITSSGSMPWVLGFRKKEGLILRSHNNLEVVLQDPEIRNFDYIDIQGMYASVFSYVESLVLLDQVMDDLTQLAADDSSGAKNCSSIELSA